MPAPNPRIWSVVLSMTAMLLWSCANQMPPAGGPVDAQGPRVVYVYPEPYSLNVSTDRIEIEFDEYVEKRSAMESIFISPPVDDLEFDWWGTSVEISFPSPLKENTTYVVSIGTDVTDLETSRRNRMDHAFSFPFSTGNSIDRGLITGTVLPMDRKDELSGVMVYAYLLPTGRADTLNVHRTTPTYVTQVGKDGSFTFSHVSLASYLVLSIRDASRNVVYDKEEDEFAVPSTLVRLSRLDTSATRLVLQLAKDDTTAPRLVKVTPTDLNHLRAEFSEPVDSSRARRPVATLIDTLTGDQRSVYTVTPILPDLKTADLTTDFLDPGTVYRLTLRGFFDQVGNRSDPSASSLVFTSGSTRDTLPPVLRGTSVRDSSKDRSVTEEVLLTFSEPIAAEQWSPERVALRTMSDGVLRSAQTRWVTESILGVRSEEEMRSDSWYELRVLLYGLLDWRLEPLKDSLVVVRFQTEDVYDTGIIEGTVEEDATPDTLGALFVLARPVDGKDVMDQFVAVGPEGAFAVRRLRPGLYSLRAFKDRNGDGVFDPGMPYPYRPSERQSGWTDTLKVRSRWPLEGVRIHLP